MRNMGRGWGGGRARGAWSGGLHRAAVALALLGTVAGLHAQVPGDDPGAAVPVQDGQDAGQATRLPQADPPSRVVRLSVLQGNVSTQAAQASQFSAAELNGVLTSGDRVYTDQAATAELQAGQVALRLGGGTDLTVTAMTDQVAQFGLASGSVHLRSYALDLGTVLEVDTAEAALTVLQAGDVRVDEDASGRATTVSVLSGAVQIDGPQMSRRMGAGERVRVHGGEAAIGEAPFLEPLAPESGDGLDGFSESRDGLYANGTQGSATYLNPDTTGSADLASYGSWDPGGEIGPVWYPAVAADWRPYCYGRWRYVAPWGWTWVDLEPWGFAPFHYGRWMFLDGRWGWLPGVPVLRPVYAPALVAFVGAGQYAASMGYGTATGVAAWFPLGPTEAYTPWYHGSTGYMNRVNASNLPSRDPIAARAIYRQRGVNVYGGALLAKTNYVNRGEGTVVVPQTSFAAGQPVARSQLRVPSAELARAPLVTQPVVPQRALAGTGLPRATPSSVPRSEAVTGSVPMAVAQHGSPVGAVTRPVFFHAASPVGARPEVRPSAQAVPRGEPARLPEARGGAATRPQNLPAAAPPRQPTAPRPVPSATQPAAGQAPAASAPRH